MPCFLAHSSPASLLSKSPIMYFWPSRRAKPITRNLPAGALSCNSSFLQFFHYLIHDWTGECPLNHPHGAEHEIRLVEIWVSAAVGRAVFVDAAKVILQERAGDCAGLPGGLAVRFRAFQIHLDGLLAQHSETPCHLARIFEQDRRPYLPSRRRHQARSFAVCTSERFLRLARAATALVTIAFARFDLLAPRLSGNSVLAAAL
jgi:hypothetical protein